MKKKRIVLGRYWIFGERDSLYFIFYRKFKKVSVSGKDCKIDDTESGTVNISLHKNEQAVLGLVREKSHHMYFIWIRDEKTIKKHKFSLDGKPYSWYPDFR